MFRQRTHEFYNAEKSVVAVSVTERDRTLAKQYDDDQKSVNDSMGDIKNDIKDIRDNLTELRLYLRKNAAGAAKLQTVREEIDGLLVKMLANEKPKMDEKKKEVVSLDKKLQKIKKNQSKIKMGYKAYKCAWYIFLLLIFIAAIVTIVFITLPEDNTDANVTSPTGDFIGTTCPTCPTCSLTCGAVQCQLYNNNTSRRLSTIRRL